MYTANGLGSGVWKLPQFSEDISITGGDTYKSFTSQSPTALDTPIQVSFGPAMVGGVSTINISGAVTINQTGLYSIGVTGRFSRTTGSGAAHLMARVLINGVALGAPAAYTMDNAKTTIPFATSFFVELLAGTVITAEFSRDSSASGVNNGGLEVSVPTLADWAPIPSATISITKLGVV